jgi:hypothetical protein
MLSLSLMIFKSQFSCCWILFQVMLNPVVVRAQVLELSFNSTYLTSDFHSTNHLLVTLSFGQSNDKRTIEELSGFATKIMVIWVLGNVIS